MVVSSKVCVGLRNMDIYITKHSPISTAGAVDRRVYILENPWVTVSMISGRLDVLNAPRGRSGILWV